MRKNTAGKRRDRYWVGENKNTGAGKDVHMNVIIPMTGYGSRFVAAGYRDLKPFIQVMGKPVIEWIVERMYPGDVHFIFVCRG